MSIHIRPACDDDVSFVFEGIRALAEFEALSHEFHGDEAKLRGHLFGSPRYAEVLIGEEDGRRAGYALYFFTYSTFETRPGIYLEDLFVVPQARRRGVARALMVELARLALQHDCRRVEWSVLDWNEKAIAFYDGIGAAPIRGWTGYRLAGPALAALGGAHSGPASRKE